MINRATPGGPTRLPVVLVVDDEAMNRELIGGYLEEVDCEVREATEGAQALAMIAADPPDLVLLDVMMPGERDGVAVCRRLKSDPAARLLPVVLVTALDDVGNRIRGYEMGADDYLSKPVSRGELVARVRSLLDLKAIFDRFDQAERVVLAFAETVEARDASTEAHQERVAASCVSVGIRLGLRDRELADLRFGALVHDIGKIGVPDRVLLKPGALDDAERLELEQHPLVGAKILAPLQSLAGSMAAVRHHHERFDGRGYPDGLSGRTIPLAARIIAVCDSFDAMTSDRPYRKGMDPEEARRLLSEGAGTAWDPEVVAVFLALGGGVGAGFEQEVLLG